MMSAAMFFAASLTSGIRVRTRVGNRLAAASSAGRHGVLQTVRKAGRAQPWNPRL